MFTSNKVHAILPKKNLRVTDVTSTIDATLHFVLLHRLVPRPNGEFSFRNIRVKSGLAMLILLVFTVCVIVDRWSLYDNPIFFFLDLLSGLIWIMQCIVSLAFEGLQKKENLQAYYDILQNIDDQLLQFKQDVYRKDRLRCNLIFFGTITVQLISLTAEFIAYKGSWSSQFVWLLSISYYIARLIVSMNILDYMTKLQVYRTRLELFHEKLIEKKHPFDARVVRRRYQKSEIGQEQRPVILISCYRLLNTLCYNINERFGFKIVMLYTNVTITTVLATYTMIAYRNKLKQFDDETFTVTIFILDVVEINLIAVWIIEYVMSIERHFRGILLALENIIATDTNNYSFGEERSNDRWRQLLALCRRRPVEFTACGFFPINYSLLAGLLATMVTYTIMLVQSNNLN